MNSSISILGIPLDDNSSFLKGSEKHRKSSEETVEVENRSVQTIVTSPPYYQKRSYQVDFQQLQRLVDWE